MGHMGNGAHGQWHTGVCGTGGIGHMGNGHMGNGVIAYMGMGYREYRPHGQWDMGCGVQGVWAP